MANCAEHDGSTPLFAVNPPEASFRMLDSLAHARASGRLLHDMSLELKTVLSQEHDTHTVTTPRYPGTLRHHLRLERYGRALDTIAGTAVQMFAEVPGFEEAAANGTLASKLRTVFSTATNVTGEEVQVVNKRFTFFGKKPVDGDVIARRIIFGVNTFEEAELLSSALQVLLHKQAPSRFRPVITGKPTAVSPHPGTDQQSARVEIVRTSEHDARSIDRTRHALWLRELRARGVTLLCLSKRTRSLWQNTETFPSWLMQELRENEMQYHQDLPATATYVDINNAAVVSTMLEIPPTRLIATDLPLSKRMRNIFNPHVRQLRGGKHRNPEQPRSLADRNSVELGVNLKRDPTTPAEAQEGAPLGRTFNVVETGMLKLHEGLLYAREHPVEAAWKALTWPFGRLSAGLADLASSESLPAAVKATRRFIADIVSWRRQQRKALAAGKELDELIEQLFMARNARDETIRSALNERGLPHVRPSAPPYESDF